LIWESEIHLQNLKEDVTRNLPTNGLICDRFISRLSLSSSVLNYEYKKAAIRLVIFLSVF